MAGYPTSHTRTYTYIMYQFTLIKLNRFEIHDHNLYVNLYAYVIRLWLLDLQRVPTSVLISSQNSWRKHSIVLHVNRRGQDVFVRRFFSCKRTFFWMGQKMGLISFELPHGISQWNQLRPGLCKTLVGCRLWFPRFPTSVLCIYFSNAFRFHLDGSPTSKLYENASCTFRRSVSRFFF